MANDKRQESQEDENNNLTFDNYQLPCDFDDLWIDIGGEG